MPPKGGNQTPGLSQEQRLWFVLGLLCTAVVCFAAGILVNKLQSRHEVASTSTGQVERLPGSKDTKPETDQSKDDSPGAKPVEPGAAEGVQVSPAPVVLPGATKDSAPPSRSVTDRTADSQFVPAPPPQRADVAEPKSDAAKADAPAESPAAPAPAQETTAPTKPDDAKPTGSSEKKAEPAPTAPKLTPMDDINSSTPPGAPTAPEAPAVTSASGFTIQVGSFDSKAAAEKLVKKIEAKGEYKATLYPSKDGKIVKVCVGSYDTKDAASKARTEMLKSKDFKGCFVKAVSEL